jgi:type IX secretion system PorP/SprF family membrane protein
MATQFSMKKWATALLLILGIGSSQLHAQQDKMFSQYMFNMMALNPAYAGSRDVLSMSALYRNQWTGVEGAPQTATFTMDMPLNKERVGIGLQLYGDKYGVLEEAGGFASYAFRIKVGTRSTLALGLQAGASSYRANLTDVKLSPDGAGPHCHWRVDSPESVQRLERHQHRCDNRDARAAGNRSAALWLCLRPNHERAERCSPQFARTYAAL